MLYYQKVTPTNLHRQGTQHINSERPQIRVVTRREKPRMGAVVWLYALYISY